jgi:hypothetical protein
LAPALLGVLVLALIVGAYGVGKLFSGSVDPSGTTPDDRLQMPSDSPGTSNPVRPLQGEPWDGDVTPLTGVHADSSCVLAPGTDAAGRTVSYNPGRALDGDFTTAWRCAGSGLGVTLRLFLESGARLAELGLVPGYAKTDPKSHVDRYAENNRITKIRWTFADGRSVVQRLNGSAKNRKMQTLRIPPVQTDSVTLEVLSSAPGPRNTIAISEIELAEAVG